jgi:hypothetical protein
VIFSVLLAPAGAARGPFRDDPAKRGIKTASLLQRKQGREQVL